MLNLLKLFSDGRALLSMFCLMFAAGAPAIGGGEGGEGAAIIPGEEGAPEGGEEGAAEGESTTEAGAAEGAEEDGKPEVKPEVQASKPLIEGDGRTLPNDLRKLVADTKATNPAMAAKIKDLYFGYAGLQNKIKQNFPGGLEEAIKLRDAVEDLAGPEGVEEIANEVTEWRGIDQMLETGNPAIFDTMAKQFPEGLKKLLPTAVEMWADSDPDGHDRHMSGVIIGTLNQNQITGDISRAIDYIEMEAQKSPLVTKALDLIKGALGKVDKIAQFAQSKPKAPERNPGQDAIDQRDRDVKQKETTLFVKELSGDVDGFTNPKIDAELKKLLKGKPITDGAKNVFFTKVRKVVADKLRAQPKFLEKYNALIDARSRDGAYKFLTTRMDPLLFPSLDGKDRGAIEQVFEELYGKATLGSGTKKKVVTPAGKPASGAPAGKVEGWIKVSPDKAPKPDEIDKKRTPFEMGFRKQAILKNGKKVYWGDKVPS
ncbi:MAG TPA: hypothetical protein VGK24_05775 [Candidatus Angelobacter sp.]|jgi:hypothetical protein